jgi:hypothetical protein
MAEVFKDWKNKFLKVFVDDVNIHNLNWRDHLQHIQMVLHHLKKVHIKLNLNKCYFGVHNIMFLGHVVNVEGSYPNPKKIATMENFPIPKTITNVRAFWGLIGYYYKFIFGYAKIIEPLFGLTKKELQICMDTHLPNDICNFEEMFDNIFSFNQLDQICHNRLF